MTDQLAEPLDVRWRSFPLEQVNSEDDSWIFWDQALDEAKGLRAFLAAEAVRDQGDVVFQRFVFDLLHAVHEAKQPVQALATIEQVAGQVPGLDVDRMARDKERLELRQRIAADYEEGVNQNGVFGTPTILFPEGDPIFLKMGRPPPEDALPLFDSIQSLSQRRRYLLELKKPRRPEGRA